MPRDGEKRKARPLQTTGIARLWACDPTVAAPRALIPCVGVASYQVVLRLGGRISYRIYPPVEPFPKFLDPIKFRVCQNLRPEPLHRFNERIKPVPFVPRLKYGQCLIEWTDFPICYFPRTTLSKALLRRQKSRVLDAVPFTYLLESLGYKNYARHTSCVENVFTSPRPGIDYHTFPPLQ